MKLAGLAIISESLYRIINKTSATSLLDYRSRLSLFMREFKEKHFCSLRIYCTVLPVRFVESCFALRKQLHLPQIAFN
jgi:hypothetical protein